MDSKKRDIGGSKDFISGLPDGLIGHILSFLTTKEVASTSVLSTKWRYLFAFVPNLDLDNSVYVNPREEKKVTVDNTAMVSQNKNNVSTSFVDFVDRVLALQGNSSVHKFSLKIQDGYDPVDPDSFFRWVSNVLQRGVSDLSLDMHLESDIMFPSELFLNKTLVRLKLKFEFDTIDVENVDLPKLKTLYLESVHLEKHGIGLTKFLSGCHALEELVLDETSWFIWDFASVSVTTLKRLKVFSEEYDEIPKSVSFDTPNLLYLEFTDNVAQEYPKVNFESLVEAKIDLRKARVKDLVGNATDFIAGICNVKILHLSANTLKVLTKCCEAIPLFNNLTHLTIENDPEIGWQSLPGLLKNSPNLETLVLQGLLHKATDGCGDVCLCNSHENEKIPTCLASSPVKVLKIMDFGVFYDEGIVEQVEQVKRFLETMPNLEELILYYDRPFTDDAVMELVYELQFLPKVASSKCNLQVISEHLCTSRIVP